MIANDEQIICRYCFEEEGNSKSEKFLDPCICTAPVHRKCLQNWIKNNENTKCEICKTEYKNLIILKNKKNPKVINVVGVMALLYLIVIGSCENDCDSNCNITCNHLAYGLGFFFITILACIYIKYSLYLLYLKKCKDNMLVVMLPEDENDNLIDV